jgi:hypothetical protein
MGGWRGKGSSIWPGKLNHNKQCSVFSFLSLFAASQISSISSLAGTYLPLISRKLYEIALHAQINKGQSFI